MAKAKTASTKKRRKRLKPTKTTLLADVQLFDMGGTLREQALKIAEEADEVYDAYEKWQDLVDKDDSKEVQVKWDILDEIADTIQASLNMAYLLGFDIFTVSDAIVRCGERQVERGRCDY